MREILKLKPLRLFLLTIGLSALSAKDAHAQTREYMEINGQSEWVQAFCSNQTMNVRTIATYGASTKDQKWKWELLRDGVVVARHQEEFKCQKKDSISCYYHPIWNFDYPIASGEYQIKLKVDQKKFLFIYGEVHSASSNKVWVEAGDPQPSFMINGAQGLFTSVCEDESILLNGAASSCEVRYRIGMLRVGGNDSGTSQWYNRRVPSSVNLRSLASTLGVPLVRGGQYRVTLEVGNPTRSTIRDFRISAKWPTPAPTLSIPDMCVGERRTISVSRIPGTTTTWEIPANLTVASAPDRYTRVVTANVAGGSMVRVTYNGLCEGSRTISGTFNVYAAPPTRPSIDGPNPVCAYQDYTYYTLSGGAVSYRWSVSAGTMIKSRFDQQALLIEPTRENAWVRVAATNACGTTNSLTKNLTVQLCNGGGIGGGIGGGFGGMGATAPPEALQVYPNPVKAGMPLTVRLALPMGQEAALPAATPPKGTLGLALARLPDNRPATGWSATLADNALTIDTSGLAPGLYAITGVVRGQYISEKIQVE